MKTQQSKEALFETQEDSNEIQSEELAEDFGIQLPEGDVSWYEQGKKEGKRVHDAEVGVEEIARGVALFYGNRLGSYDGKGELGAGARDFLNAYAAQWSNPDTAKSRKTDMKAIFDAFAMRDQERELPVGFTKPEKGSKESPTPIKETHPIVYWLVSHNKLSGYEGFKGLVQLAKYLRGPASGRGAGGGAQRGPRVVTDKQQEEIVGRVEVMNQNQAHQVAQRSLHQLSKLPGFEVVQFRLIVAACDMILNKSTDEGAKKRAQAIRDQAEDMVERLLAADKEKLAATPKITSDKPVAPIPAEKPIASQEKGEKEQKAA